MRTTPLLFCAILSLLFMAACGVPGAAQAPSLEVSQPPTDLVATRKGNTVSLSWTEPLRTTDGQGVRLKKLGPTLVCRGVKDFPMAKCVQIVGQTPPVEPAPAANAGEKAAPLPRLTFQDTLPADIEQMYPTAFVTYAVEVMNWRWRSAGLSNQVQIPLAPVLPQMPPVKAEVTAEGIVLKASCWTQTPPKPSLRYACHLYRQQKGTDVPVLIQSFAPDTPACDSIGECHVLDRGIEWEATYSYWVTGATEVLENGKQVAEVESDNSEPVSVLAHDIFPPAQPAGVQAVASGVGQKSFVDLTWTPNTDPDLAGYNIYRRESGGNRQKLNTALVTPPAYRDETTTAGHTYIYDVTAVDARGNEGPPSESAEEAVP